MEKIQFNSYMLLHADGTPFHADHTQYASHSEAMEIGKASNSPFLLVAFDTLSHGRRKLRISVAHGGAFANLAAIKVFDDMVSRQTETGVFVTPRSLAKINA